MNIEIFEDEAALVGNLDIDTDYEIEKTLPFKIKIIKNQGVPIHQIKDFFVVKIDKGKVDPTTAIKESKRAAGGDVDRMKDLNKKLNKEK